MEIGPITAVRPVPAIKPSSVAPDLSRVFEVEYLGQSDEDEYRPSNRKAGRGLEDEEEGSAEETAEAETTPPGLTTKVNFFA
jgi:hypothetical protein